MIGKQLKALRKEKGYTQAELAKKLHLTPKAISFYENNQREPDIETLYKIADIFDVSIDYLNGRKNKVKKGEDYVRINVYGSVPAGVPIEAIEDISDTEDLSFNDFDPNKQYLGLKVDGDSMYPKYLDGDTIILELTSDCESYTDAAVYVNGYEATLKTLIKNNDGTALSSSKAFTINLFTL